MPKSGLTNAQFISYLCSILHYLISIWSSFHIQVISAKALGILIVLLVHGTLLIVWKSR